MPETDVSFWNTPQQDQTPSDTVKVAAMTAIVSVAAPMVFLAALGGVMTLKEKYQLRKLSKEAAKLEEQKA